MTDHEHTPEPIPPEFMERAAALRSAVIWQSNAANEIIARALMAEHASAAPTFAAGVEAAGLRTVEDMHERAWARESDAGNLDKAEWHRECATAIRSLAASSSRQAAEPSEAEVEAAARAMCRRILLVSYDENRVDAIVDVRWRGWGNDARVALIAAAHTRASQQGARTNG